jgi:hypothetical protein
MTWPWYLGIAIAIGIVVLFLFIRRARRKPEKGSTDDIYPMW